MTLPTIHNNGTSASDLCDRYQAAATAIETARQAVAECCPNARDYYPQGANAYSEARAEHSTRLDKLEEIRADLETLAIHCADHIR